MTRDLGSRNVRRSRPAHATTGIAVAVVLAAGLAGCGTPPHHDLRRDGPDMQGPVRVVLRGAPVTIAEGETHTGSLVVVGGEARVDGRISGSLVVVGGTLEMGPSANVGGDLVAVGNERQVVAPGVVVEDEWIDVNFAGVGSVVDSAIYAWDHPLVVVLGGLAALLLVGGLGYRRVVRRYEDASFHGTLSQRPVRSGLVALAFFVVVFATALAAFLSHWFAGVAVALWVTAGIAGATGWILAGVHLGRAIAAWRGWKPSPFVRGLLGVGIWAALCFIPVVGHVAAVAGTLAALGALLAPSHAAPADPPPVPASDPVPAPAGA